MLFVCYPRCSTCQKAQKWLAGQGITAEVRHIKGHARHGIPFFHSEV